eukprot:4268238-Amphidinium_carterae.1
MALQESLQGYQKLSSGRGRVSIFYGADEYLTELRKKFENNPEIAAMKGILPDEGDPNAANVKSNSKMLSVEKN